MNMLEFLKEIEKIKEQLSPEAQEFLCAALESGGKSAFTENGIKILKAMKDNQEKYINIFTAKNLGEILFMSPRSVSGSMKKLIAEGYVEKVGLSPVSYGLTDKGKACEFDM